MIELGGRVGFLAAKCSNKNHSISLSEAISFFAIYAKKSSGNLPNIFLRMPLWKKNTYRRAKKL